MKNKLLTIVTLLSMITGAYLFRNELIAQFIAIQSKPEFSETFVDREETNDSGMHDTDLDFESKLGEVRREKVGISTSAQLVEKTDPDESVESKNISVTIPEKNVNGIEVIEDVCVGPDGVMSEGVQSNIPMPELTEIKVPPD